MFAQMWASSVQMECDFIYFINSTFRLFLNQCVNSHPFSFQMTTQLEVYFVRAMPHRSSQNGWEEGLQHVQRTVSTKLVFPAGKWADPVMQEEGRVTLIR